LESDTSQLNRTWHDLPELIGVALQRLAPELTGRVVTVRVGHELPLVWGNAVLLEHVLTNLLENAVKYTPPGSPIVIAADLAPGPKAPALMVTIRDHGPGIAPDELERIFDKFYRGTATSRRVRGSGLGLTICRGILAAHGGAILAANCPDGGAAFTLTLPLEGGAPAAAAVGALVHEEGHVQDTGAHRRG
ncbi:MAG TPA: ATP-binding protein, partial [Chloroflexaceae bacterium]|nr:ATP-binding protein [Chloroflexaceae bacterium]